MKQTYTADFVKNCKHSVHLGIKKSIGVNGQKSPEEDDISGGLYIPWHNPMSKATKVTVTIEMEG